MSEAQRLLALCLIAVLAGALLGYVISLRAIMKLEDKVRELESRVSELSKAYEELKTRHEELSSRFEELSKDYEALKQDYLSLKSEYEELMRALETIPEMFAEEKVVTGAIGEPIVAGCWRITVLNVSEADYIMETIGDMVIVYKPRPNAEFIIVRLRFENIGNRTESMMDVWNFTLITSDGSRYSMIYPMDLEEVENLTAEILERTAKIELLDTLTDVFPGESIEGDIIFQVLKDVKPAKLAFNIGVIGGYTIIIDLS